MYPNRKLGYTLQGSREARYVILGARLHGDEQKLGQAIEDRQGRVWSRVYCSLLESNDQPQTNEWLSAQANKAEKTAEVQLPPEFNESVIEGLGHITTLSSWQAMRLGVRRSVARNMLAAAVSPLAPLPASETPSASPRRTTISA